MKAPRRRGRIRKLRLLALLTVLGLLAGVAFSFGLVRAIASEIPSLDPSQRRGSVDGVVYASNGRSVLAVIRGDESRVLLSSIDDVAPIMRQAIVSVEDRRFYEHNGVDLRGIARALWQDIRSQSVVEGGSTITQQFVKNAYIRNERTVGRKVREAALAWQLEQRWSKDRILLAYLNTIYFGNGAYGVQQAARTYFDMGASRLTLAQAALLAGLQRNPSLYDPVQHPRAARDRRSYVLRLMVEQGKITTRQAARARSAALPNPQNVRLPGTRGPAPYFVNYVTDQLIAKYGAGRVYGGGLKVTTTIDLGLQELAGKAIDKVLGDDGDGPAAALVAIDPRDGSVKAMYGGTSFRKSQFNLATQAERQPGSSFKPIVLATALRQGIAPSTRFDSKPVEIDAGDRVWKVTNYENRYLGRVDLWRAMISSDNAVYAQLTKTVGPKGIVKTAHELGIRSKLNPYFSIGLGAVAVNPLDMTRAYATIANDGKRVDGSLMGDRPRVIESVERVKSGERQENDARRGSRPQRGQGAPAHRDPGGRRQVGNRPARGHRLAARRRQDRDDRRLRRRLVRRLHAAAGRGRLGRISERAPPDADRVRRPAGHRRDAAGVDLEGVHRGGARAGGRRAGAVPGRARNPGAGAARRLPWRLVEARQRRLPRHERVQLLRRRRPLGDRRVLLERGHRAARRRAHR